MLGNLDILECSFYRNSDIRVIHTPFGWWDFSSVVQGGLLGIRVRYGLKNVDDNSTAHLPGLELAIAIPKNIKVGERILVVPYRNLRKFEERGSDNCKYQIAVLGSGEFVAGGSYGYNPIFLVNDPNCVLYVTLDEISESQVKLRIEGAFLLIEQMNPTSTTTPRAWTWRCNMSKAVLCYRGMVNKPEEGSEVPVKDN